MKILFDHNVDRRFRRYLGGHGVTTTREMGWEELENGTLIAATAEAGFEVFLSVDKKIRYEQNLDQLPIPIVVLDCLSNALPALIPFAPHVQDLLKGSLSRVFHLIAPDGSVTRFGSSEGT